MSPPPSPVAPTDSRTAPSTASPGVGPAALRILVVEDELKLANILRRALTEQGHAVILAHDGTDAIRSASAGRFDVVLLDRMLPGMDGMEVCTTLRERGIGAHVIMLTARGTVDDRVDGLHAGADDYLVKPFALQELLARVDAVGRRSERYAHLGEREVVGVGPIRLDLTRQVAIRDGRRIPIRPKEFAILTLLVSAHGGVVSRERLVAAGWPEGAPPQSNSLEVTIRRLRASIDDPFEAACLETVRGSGYRLRDE